MFEFNCRFCHQNYPANPLKTFCPECREPLLITPPSGHGRIEEKEPGSPERYQSFLPLGKINHNLLLDSGRTPLQKLDRLSHHLDIPGLFAKNEGVNPTGSFKDRGTMIAIHAAGTFGHHVIGTVSTGNMAVSTAAFAAKAGLKCLVLAKHDTPNDKLIPAGIFGARTYRVKGDYGELMRKSLELGAKKDIYFMNSVDPFRIEGYKVIGYEIFEQLGRRIPGAVVAPVSAGGHIIGLMRAFHDLKRSGLTDSMPEFIGVQATGCAPVAQAFEKGLFRVQRLTSSNTIAQSISNPDPPGGNIVLSMIRESGGQILHVPDKEILAGQKLLARYGGIFCLPASATTLAGVIALHRKRLAPSNRPVVMVITGSGRINPGAVNRAGIEIEDCTLSELEFKISKKT